ncbi:MAG TPA: hypothetical protein VMW35_16295 [Myxococcota bacterium]|jgi:hypothetical protein|nr:hypothetical protein [Myxococcota bacterium]
MSPATLQLDRDLMRDLEVYCRRAAKAPVAEGAGLAPLAFHDQAWGISRSQWRRRWRLRDGKAAARWNELWSGMLGEAGTPFAPLLELGGEPIDEPCLAATARVAAQLLHEEVRSGMPCPEVRAGWSFELVVAQSFRRSGVPGIPACLLLLLDAGWRDERDEPLWFSEALRECSVDELPRRGATLLLSTGWREHEETFAG